MSPTGSPAKANLVARRRRKEWGYRDRESEWLSAGRRSNLRFVARRIFNQITFDPDIRRYGTDLEFWQSLLKKQVNFMQRNYPGVSRHRRGVQFVCETSSDSAPIKRHIKFDVKYLTRYLHPPLPRYFLAMKENR